MKRLVLLTLLAACGEPEVVREPCDPIVGNICTIVGNGENGYSGDDGDALDAELSLPQDTLHTPDGTLYVLDWNNHRVRKLMADGTIHHVAGRGELGGTLDDPANDDFNHPTGVTLNPAGTHMIVAAWHNSKLRSINLADHSVSDISGDGRRAYFGDGTPAVAATLDLPASVAYAPSGELLFMDQANQVIRAIDGDGIIRRFAGQCVIDSPAPVGPGPCEANEEPIQCPQPGSGRTTCGEVATCGLPCTPGYGGDDGPAMDLRMSQPFGQSADPGGRLVFDAQGNLYFADPVNALIRKIDEKGTVTRFAGTAPVGGVPQTGHTGDGGPATAATFYNPVDLAIDTDGTMYVSDVYNHCIRAIGSDGNVRTVAGICGDPGYDGDRGAALAAHLKRPYGVEVFGDFLYISDTGNNVVRAVRLR